MWAAVVDWAAIVEVEFVVVWLASAAAALRLVASFDCCCVDVGCCCGVVGCGGWLAVASAVAVRWFDISCGIALRFDINCSSSTGCPSLLISGMPVLLLVAVAECCVLLWVLV